MKALFLREMRANLKGLIGWSVGVASLTIAGFVKFDAMLDPSINTLMASWPRVLVVLFTGGFTHMANVADYYGIMYTYLILLVACQAAMLGGNILSKEERDRTSEFLFVKPISRVKIVTTKLLAAVVNITVVTCVCYFATIFSFGHFAGVSEFMPKIHELTLGMYFVQLMFLTLGTGLSGLVSNNRKANTLAGLAVLATFFIAKFIQLAGNVDFLSFLSPFLYFEPAAVYRDGLTLLYVGLASLIVIGMGTVTYVTYRKRDLKV